MTPWCHSGSNRQIAIFHTRCEDSDDTLVPLGIEQAQAERHRLDRQILQLSQRFTLHALLNGFAVLVHAVELSGHFTRQTSVFGEQAFDAQAHVIQTPRRIQTRANNETQVGRGDARVVTLGDFEDRLDPRPRAPGANPLEALVHQNPVVGIQRYHVGDAAQGHKVQQLAGCSVAACSRTNRGCANAHAKPSAHRKSPRRRPAPCSETRNPVGSD